MSVKGGNVRVGSRKAVRPTLVGLVIGLGACLSATPLAPSPFAPLPLALTLQRPLPDEQEFFEAARTNLARSNEVQYQYAYKERRTELHMNPFGRLGTGEVRLYQVTPGPSARVYFRQLLERAGKRVPEETPERQERRPTTGRSLNDVIATLRFTLSGREVRGGRDMIVVGFEARPDADPQTRQGSIAKVLKGRIWVDEAAREVVRAEATAVDSVTFGGIVARLNEGAEVTFTRERADGDVWLPTSVRMKGTGRALLVRRMTIDYSIEWFDYRKP
jgi:hypothetical protein